MPLERGPRALSLPPPREDRQGGSSGPPGGAPGPSARHPISDPRRQHCARRALLFLSRPVWGAVLWHPEPTWPALVAASH